MDKGKLIIAVALLAAPGAFGQVNDSVDIFWSENAEMFTEDDLTDEVNTNQATPSVISSQSDPYSSNVGYRFSAARYKRRAYDYRYSQTFLNGLYMNDYERGGFTYSMLGGLNDISRNREDANSSEYNTFSVSPIGGSSNINMRPSVIPHGSRATISGANRNYILRGMFTHSTGILPSGWAFTGSVGYRWAHEGVIDGTFYNSLGYFLGAEKRFGNGHALSLVTFGAPTKRGTQAGATEETYWLANSHYYNPNWGYQNGKKRNARVTRTFDPTALLTWDWKISESQKLSATAGFKWSHWSRSRLTYGEGGYDPRPDYYKNLPSSTLDVDYNNPGGQTPFYTRFFLLDEWQTLYDYWRADESNRQIQWDRMYYSNMMANKMGAEALYYLYRDNTNQMQLSLGTNYSINFNPFNKASVGLQIGHNKASHFQTMDDLLGAELFTDYDRYSARDYGEHSQTALNDMLNPRAQVKEGDKFGYNYNIFVDKANLWAQYQYNKDNVGILLAGNMEGTMIEREGLMMNGRAPENSYGKSGKAKFLGGGGKAALNFRTPYSRFNVGFNYNTLAPLPMNSFVAPRIKNDFVDNLHLEHVFGVEASWNFTYGPLSGVVHAYYTQFRNGVEQTGFYDDSEGRFTYLTMSGVEKKHYGIEAALVLQINSHLSLNLMGTINDARYANNANAQQTPESANANELKRINTCTIDELGVSMPLQVMTKGLRVSGTPLTAASLGVRYNINGWYFSANLNYYDRIYIGFSQYQRLNRVLAETARITREVNNNGDIVIRIPQTGGVYIDPETNEYTFYKPKQEKFKGNFLLDVSVGHSFRLDRNKTLNVNLSVNNVLNNRNMKTGGFEQNRGNMNSDGNEKVYDFLNNPKYFYANAINAFLNVTLRF